MKNLLLSLSIFLSIATFGQQIPGSRLVDESVREIKLHDDALRPVNGGVLPSGELTFSEPSERFSKSVTSDLALTLAASGNTAYSEILIEATGDGSHVVTFPIEWNVTGAWVPDNFQRIYLYYDGTYVDVTIKQVIVAPITITLVSAIVTNTPPTNLNLTFSEAVNLTTDGWSVTASGGAIILETVSGNGSPNPVFLMNRAIVDTETVTISYEQSTGQSHSLSGTREVAEITDQTVTPPDDLPDPEIPDFDVIVDPAGTHTTIQAGSNAAVSGNIVGIKGGTYRETIIGKSGVTYKNFPGETVIVSGLELAGNTGWTVHSGNIYKKTITLPVQATYHNVVITSNTTLLSNQIFKDGDMMITAQWPNRVNMDDMFDQSKLRRYSNTSVFSNTQITDAGLAIGTHGSLVGGRVYTQGWFRAFNSNITSHSGNQINFPAAATTTGPPSTSTGISADSRFRKYYYVADDLGLLDVANEWFYDPSVDILYAFQVGGGSPTGLEYKARNYGFDLRSASNVTIDGLHFIGCEPAVGSASSANLILDNIRATYMNHGITDLQQSHPGFGIPRKLGMTLIGANNIVRNSEFKYSSSTAIWAGPNCLIDNNLFEYINYEGNWGAPVGLYDKDDDQTITNNTGRILGRGFVDFGWVNFSGGVGGNHERVEIAYNDMGFYGRTCWDLGAIYSHGTCNQNGGDFHHNWIHDVSAPDGNDVGSNSGIYHDQASGGAAIHHNVFWNVSTSDVYHETSNPDLLAGRPMNYYNNTFASTDVTNSANSSYRTYEHSPLDIQRNNIYWRRIVFDWIPNNVGNTQSYIMKTTSPYHPNFTAQDPLFVGGNLATDKGHYFLLQTGSPAKNTGVSSFTGVGGVNVNIAAFGAGVDKGAYDFEDPDPWTAGYNATPTVADGVINDNLFTYSANWFYSPNFKPNFQDGDAHFTITDGALATYEFTGSQVQVIAEKCDNMGTARIRILSSAAAVLQNTTVNLYNDSDGTDLDPCPAGVLGVVFTSSAFGGGMCTDCTVEISLDAQDLTTTPDRNALVFDGVVVVP